MYLTAFVISMPHALKSRILKHVELIFIGLSKRPLTSRISKLRCFFVSFPLFCFLYQMTQTLFFLRLLIHAILKHVKISCLSIIEKWPCLNRTCKCQNYLLDKSRSSATPFARRDRNQFWLINIWEKNVLFTFNLAIITHHFLWIVTAFLLSIIFGLFIFEIEKRNSIKGKHTSLVN